MNTFSCKRNTDIEYFLKEKAILFEKQNISRTYIIFDTEIIGYFSIALKVLELSADISKTSRKKMHGFSKEIESIPVFLIGQIGKNDLKTKSIAGKDLLALAEMKIQECNDIIGGRVILLECENIDKLVTFYKTNSYIELQKSDKDLIQFIKYVIN